MRKPKHNPAEVGPIGPAPSDYTVDDLADLCGEFGDRCREELDALVNQVSKMGPTLDQFDFGKMPGLDELAVPSPQEPYHKDGVLLTRNGNGKGVSQ